MASSTPATTGPSIAASVPKPASSAFADGSSSGSSSRAGHVASAGRLNVYSPAESDANTYSGHSNGSSSNAFTAMSADITARISVRHDHEPAALDRVGERTTDDREHEAPAPARTSPSSPTASVDPVIS